MEKINTKVEKKGVISGEKKLESGENRCDKWRKKTKKVEKIGVTSGENRTRKVEKMLA